MLMHAEDGKTSAQVVAVKVTAKEAKNVLARHDLLIMLQSLRGEMPQR